MITYVLLIEFDAVIIRPYSYKSLKDHKLPVIDAAFRFNPKPSSIQLLRKNCGSSIHQLIFSRFFKVSELKSYTEFYGITGKYTQCRSLNPKEKSITEYLDSVYDEEYKNGKSTSIVLIPICSPRCIETLKNAIGESKCKKFGVRYILVDLFSPNRYDLQQVNCGKLLKEVKYFFSDNAISINNDIACLTNRSDSIVFMRRHRSADTSVCNDVFYLFDYYKTGKDSTIMDTCSKSIVEELKMQSGENNKITRFFCRSVIDSIQKDMLNDCCFLVVPSSKTDRWNQKICDTMSHELSARGYRYDTLVLRSIRRITSIEPAHLGGSRIIEYHLSSLELCNFSILKFKNIILLDDITTTGNSFIACAQLLRNNGFKGNIQPIAVAGTVSQRPDSISLTSNNLILSSKRSTAEVGYIFDLDNTLINSNIAKEDRENKNWPIAISKIKLMKEFVFVTWLFKVLICQGKDVAIVTSAPENYCKAIISKLGIEWESIIHVCYHDTHKHKPSADPIIRAQSLMIHDNKIIYCIGDEESDIIACLNANKEDSKREYVPVLAAWNVSKSLSFLECVGKYSIIPLESEYELPRIIDFSFPINKTETPDGIDLYHYFQRVFLPMHRLEPVTYKKEFNSIIDSLGIMNIETKRLTDVGRFIGLTEVYHKSVAGKSYSTICIAPSDQWTFISSIEKEWNKACQFSDNSESCDVEIDHLEYDEDYSEQAWAASEGFYIDDDGNWCELPDDIW